MCIGCQQLAPNCESSGIDYGICNSKLESRRKIGCRQRDTCIKRTNLAGFGKANHIQRGSPILFTQTPFVEFKLNQSWNDQVITICQIRRITFRQCAIGQTLKPAAAIYYEHQLQS